MSVLIKGMEMPNVCIEGDWYGNCPMDRIWCAQRFAPEGYTHGRILADMQDKLPDWCPLRPLPEKHGRLIDAKALDVAFTHLRFNDDGSLNHWGDRADWCLHGNEVEILIKDAETIVEAEE